MTCPSTSIVPPSGRWAPVMTLMSVDLPAPFSPTSAWTSPARRSNETPFSAWTPAKDLRISERRRRGATVDPWIRRLLLGHATLQRLVDRLRQGLAAEV